MRRIGLLGFVLAGLVPSARAQQPRQPILGVVLRLQDTLPIAGAEVLIGTRSTVTNAEGRFRVDSMAPGLYPLTVRSIGYRPVRSRIAVVATEPTQAEYYLAPVAVRLPALMVAAERGGIWGTVGDSEYHPLEGAKVFVYGIRGGETESDSLGRFRFPNASGGTYIVRVQKPGYAERRLQVELPNGRGVELAFRLSSELRPRFAPGEDDALWNLGRRLVFELKRSRMTTGDLARYGSTPLCEVPRARALGGDPTTVIVNGITVLPQMSLCAWRADEVDLLEFCGQMRSCAGLPDPFRARRPGARRSSGGAVIIWEKR